MKGGFYWRAIGDLKHRLGEAVPHEVL